MMSVQQQEIIIREMTVADAAEAAELSGELGYPATAAVMEERLRRVATSEDHTVLAADCDGSVVGWVDVGVVQHLQSETYGEIGGLVVGEAWRSRRIGQKLVEAAEAWIAGRGIGAVVVRSRSTRERAHAFYLRQGYSLVKTSVVFRKAVRSGD